MCLFNNLIEIVRYFYVLEQSKEFEIRFWKPSLKPIHYISSEFFYVFANSYLIFEFSND